MSKKLILLLSFAVLFVLPTITWADPNQLGLEQVMGALSSITSFIFYMFLGISVIMFIIAGYYFLTSDVTKGRAAVIWGVVGIAVAILAFSIPGIVGTLLGTGL